MCVWYYRRLLPSAMSLGLLLRTAVIEFACTVPSRYLVNGIGGSVAVEFVSACTVFCRNVSFISRSCFFFFFFSLLAHLERVAGYYCGAGSVYPRPCPVQHFCPSYGTIQPVPCQVSRFAWPGSSACSETIPLVGAQGGLTGYMQM
jgi:hypothetical protein